MPQYSHIPPIKKALHRWRAFELAPVRVVTVSETVDVEIGCPLPTLGKHRRELKNPFVLWHNAEFGIVLAAKGRQEIVASEAYKAHLAVLAKRARQPRPPRIKALLIQARELKTRLIGPTALPREALAKEAGLGPGQLTRLLRLADLAPEIQQYILAMPPSAGWGPVTERSLRPIAKSNDRQYQLAEFRRLLLSRDRKVLTA